VHTLIVNEDVAVRLSECKKLTFSGWKDTFTKHNATHGGSETSVKQLAAHSVLLVGADLTKS